MKYDGNRDHRESEQFRKLFIGGLDQKTTEDSLRSHFGQWGEIVDAVVMRDPETKRSRGFGFVTYSRAAMVDDAQDARPHRVDGREVQPKRAVPRQLSGKADAGASVKKIFLGGLKEDVEDEDLREYFGKYGTITDAEVVIDKDTKRKRGFGFVEFDDYDPVDKIILEGNHYLKGRDVDVKKAVSKREMFDHKQKQDRPARGGRGDWDGPRTNEQPSWNRGSVGDGGYNQGPGWGGGYGGPGPAPQGGYGGAPPQQWSGPQPQWGGPQPQWGGQQQQWGPYPPSSAYPNQPYGGGGYPPQGGPAGGGYSSGYGGPPQAAAPQGWGGQPSQPPYGIGYGPEPVYGDGGPMRGGGYQGGYQRPAPYSPPRGGPGGYNSYPAGGRRY
ncbi:heterogeneous nuclear ribonucleoprotein A1, A2/B1 homolog [Artemia franciscana]|uniref:heterogeneous nuclear ribonucleoprotein A1, A2/B1 homolog n=1 Tax=Artemia franciscana TaxID=6661 RepID=UPI0032D9B119